MSCAKYIWYMNRGQENCRHNTVRRHDQADGTYMRVVDTHVAVVKLLNAVDPTGMYVL